MKSLLILMFILTQIVNANALENGFVQDKFLNFVLNTRTQITQEQAKNKLALIREYLLARANTDDKIANEDKASNSSENASPLVSEDTLQKMDQLVPENSNEKSAMTEEDSTKTTLEKKDTDESKTGSDTVNQQQNATNINTNPNIGSFINDDDVKENSKSPTQDSNLKIKPAMEDELNQQNDNDSAITSLYLPAMPFTDEAYDKIANNLDAAISKFETGSQTCMEDKYQESWNDFILCAFNFIVKEEDNFYKTSGYSMDKTMLEFATVLMNKTDNEEAKQKRQFILQNRLNFLTLSVIRSVKIKELRQLMIKGKYLTQETADILLKCDAVDCAKVEIINKPTKKEAQNEEDEKGKSETGNKQRNTEKNAELTNTINESKSPKIQSHESTEKPIPETHETEKNTPSKTEPQLNNNPE